MKRFTRLALAALAAIGASGALVATSAASWTNFKDTTSEGTVEGVRQYTLSSGDYRITINGTPNAYGSVTLGTSTAATNNTGIVLTAGAPIGTKQVSVMLDVGNLPTTTAELLAIKLAADGSEVELKRVVENSTSTIQQQWNNNNGDNGGWGRVSWTPGSRQILTVTYGGDSNPTGTATYLNGSPLIANVSGLMTTGSNIDRIGIGENVDQPATNLKVYGLYLFTTKLSAAQVASETVAVVNAYSVPLSFAFSRAGMSTSDNVMNVTYTTNGGTSTTTSFTATLGTNATRKTDGGGESNEGENPTPFFKSVTTGSSLLTTNDYPMIACKFVTNAASQRGDEGWSVYLPFTPSVAATVTRVCPKLFAVTSDGAVQGTPRKVFGYTVTLYSGSVDATTESPTALATATGTTDSLSGTTVNTKAADFTDKVTLNADTTYTMKLEVSASETGGGSYSGIGGVVFSNVASRTVSGKTGNWSTADEWDNRLVPTIVTPTTLNVSDAASLALDTSAFLPSLTVNDTATEGSASLTFTGTGSLTSTTTTLNANTDVSAITANLGAVTLASGKTLTVGTLEQVASLSATNGTLATTGNTALAAGSTLLNGVTNLIVRGGTFSSSLSGSSALATGRNITVTGDGTNLLLAVKDGTGWNSAGPGIRVEDGGTLTFGVRDTLKTPITLCGGTLTCGESAADDHRALDFYNGSGNIINVEKAKTGTAEAPTTSYITVAGTGENARLAIRNGALTFNVADSAKLQVSANISPNCGGDGTAGAVTKSGDGVLELKAANSFTTGLTISGGRVLVTGKGTLGTGTVTVNEGKTLEVQVADSATKTIANTLSGAGTVKKLGAGTLSLTGTVSAPVEVVAGKLKLGASVTSSSVTVSGGVLEMGLPSSARTITANGGEGKLVLLLTESEAAAESLTTQLSWTGDVSQVEVRNSDGALLARRVSKNDESNRLELTVREALTWRWTTNASSWASGLPGFASGDSVTFGSNATSETVVVPSKTTVGAMSVAGQYAFTVAPGGLTASQITVSGTAKFNRLTVNHVRLTASNTNTSGNAPALAELLLTKNREVVLWPRGTTISQLNSNGTTTPPNWRTESGNEAVNALIDGVWKDQPNYTNPQNGDTGRYGTRDPGNNKWWPTADPAAYAVINLGAAIDFDGYQLRTADTNDRSPRDWSLEVSADNTTWFVADWRANQTTPTTHSLYVYEGSNTVFPLPTIAAPITVSATGTLGGDACVAGNVTFEPGATLDATGATPLEVTGTVTATSLTVLVPENAWMHPVLKTTTEGLESAFSAEGYSFLYREGAYWALLSAAKTLTAEVTAEVTAESNLTDLTWKRTDDVAIDPEMRERLFALPEVTATLNTTSAATVTIDCAVVPALTLSGSAAVMLAAADDVAPAIASLTVAADSTVAATLLNAVTGATTIQAGKVLTLTGTAVSLEKLPTGTGSVKIPDESSITYTNGDNAYSGWTTVEGELTLACTLEYEKATADVPTYPISVDAGGKVKLADGGSTYRSFQGEGDIEVTGNATLGIPGRDDGSIEGGFSLTGTITVDAGATLTIEAWQENIQVLSGANLCVKGSIVRYDYPYAYEPTVVIASGKTLSGTGEINVPVAFSEGSILDTVTAAPLLLKGKVTGPIKVKLDTAKTVLTATDGAELNRAMFAFASDPTSQTFATGYRFADVFRSAMHNFMVVPKLRSLPGDLPTVVSGNEAAQNAIYDAVATAKTIDNVNITSVTGVTAQSTGGVAGSTEALALFDNLHAEATASAAADGTGTVKVYYDFGISQLHVKNASLVNEEAAQLYVLLCAKVATTQNTTTANYATGTTVTLYRGTEVQSAVEPTDDQLRALGITPAAGEKWFAVPMSTLGIGTHAFKVKAFKTSTAN